MYILARSELVTGKTEEDLLTQFAIRGAMGRHADDVVRALLLNDLIPSSWRSDVKAASPQEQYSKVLQWLAHPLYDKNHPEYPKELVVQPLVSVEKR